MKWMHRHRLGVAIVTVLATLLTHLAPLAAWYDPKTGRFLQRDPNGTALLVSDGLSYHAQNPTVHVWLTPELQYGDGQNFYQYVMSNPVNRTDPSGLFTIPDMAARMGAYGAMVGGSLGWMRSYATYADEGSNWQQASAFFKGAGIGGATGFGMGLLAAAIGNAAGSLSVGVTAVGLMTAPTAVGLSIGELYTAETYADRLMAGIDLGLAGFGLLASHAAMFSVVGPQALSATTIRVNNRTIVRVNLGGEGEVPGAINVQGKWALEDGWASSGGGKSLSQLKSDGHQIIIADNKSLPFASGSIDEVITNSVPIDMDTHLGPGIQSSEVMRILKPGGKWVNNGTIKRTK